MDQNIPKSKREGTFCNFESKWSNQASDKASPAFQLNPLLSLDVLNNGQFPAVQSGVPAPSLPLPPPGPENGPAPSALLIPPARKCGRYTRGTGARRFDTLIAP